MQENNIQHNPYDRVRNLSPQKFNQTIDKKTDQLLYGLKSQGSAAIRARIRKLDQEWDIDRAAMLLVSGVVFTQLLATFKKQSRIWSWSAMIQLSFLILHSTLGWSPPVSMLRKLGFRTRYEIQEEREELLKILAYEDPLNEAGVYGKA